MPIIILARYKFHITGAEARIISQQCNSMPLDQRDEYFRDALDSGRITSAELITDDEREHTGQEARSEGLGVLSHFIRKLR